MKFKFTRAVRRRAACIGLSAVMCATFAAGQITAFAANGGSGLSASADGVYDLDFENANGKIDLTQIKLDNLSKDVIKNDGVSSDVYSLTRTLIVTLEGAPLSERSYAGKSAQIEIAEEQQAFLSELKRAGISYKFRSSYASIANAVAIDVKLSEYAKIKALKGVATVSVGSTYARPKTVESSDGVQQNDSNIYKTGIYNSSAQVAAGYDGSGMTVAVLDTGLDYTHPAFTKNPAGANPISFTYDYVDGKIKNTSSGYDEDFGTNPVPFQSLKNVGATTDDVYLSEKVPFAFDYADRDTDVFPSYSQHGTHVAGIIAGKADSYTDKDGNVPTEEDGEGNEYPVPFRGVAPEAQLVICKVFTDNLDDDSIGGAEAVDILDALEDCYNLNVDVINMSLGTSGGFSSRALCPSGAKEEDEEGYLMKSVYKRVRDKGISLIVAASNDFSAGFGSAFGTNLTSNPDSGTVGSPSTFTGALSVASINGQYASYIMANAYDVNGNPVNGGNVVYFEESRNEDSEAYDFVDEMLTEYNRRQREAAAKAGTEYQDVDTATVRYVVVPGTGESTDYLPNIKQRLKPRYDGEMVIAVVQRGSSQFKDKISTAIHQSLTERDPVTGNRVTTPVGAAAVIVYNNVSGIIRMSLGDMREHVPAISVSLEAGLQLTGDGKLSEGTITVSRNYNNAGPFMNDYSSWGATPDLKLKPDVTSHGGEITSAVAGGYYDEMSGTSMACPNLAGFEAIFKGYLKNKPELWRNNELSDEQNALALTKLTNNIVMSTAVTVYDQNRLPYSPRKQGAGLATLANVFSTKAYLFTDENDEHAGEDGRPKYELGDDKNRSGVYNIAFSVKNFGDTSLTFKTNSIFMTETVGKDNMSVAEKAYLLNKNAQWTVGGQRVAEGGEFNVPAGEVRKIEVTLRLTDAEKKYLNDNFKNGMFVEGFLQLISQDGTQCDLNLPFLGFYGDWKDAPMMDLTCFDVAKDAKDTSLKDEERAQPRVWATQPYGYFAGETYTIPLGSFLYVQDEAKEHTSDYVYVEEEHIAVSRDFHEYYGDNDPNNYLTTTGIKALYAGLLRGAEVVTYTLTNVDTGEVIRDERGNETRVIYRANKSFAGGGNSMPSQVLLELKPDELGLAANGKYNLDFRFYFDYNDYEAYINGDEDAFKNEQGETYGVYKDNSFSMNFYVDYEAPVLVDSRIRFVNLKDESNKDYQQVYLDLDIYDNHYPQSVILCYADTENATDVELTQIKLATDYVIPVLNPRKNSVNTVSVDITEFYTEEYRGKLWVEIDDYALNHNTYNLNLNYMRTHSVAPGDFDVTLNGKVVANNGTVTLKRYEAVKFGIKNNDETKTGWDISNFGWETSDHEIASVKNGELYAADEGSTMLTVTGGLDANGRPVTKTVWIEVEGENSDALPHPANVKATFDVIVNGSEALSKAEGMVEVSSGQKFRLKPVLDPWYFPTDGIVWVWTADSGANNPDRATVDQNGNVNVIYEGEYSEDVTVTATAHRGSADGEELFKAEVILSIQPSFTSNGTAITRYRGVGGELKDRVQIGNQVFENVRVLEFPENITATQIADEAFKDNENVEIVIIPKSVATIGERVFEDCVNLKAVCFVQLDKQDIPDSSLTLISESAFTGCENLQVVDLSNCKLFTVARTAFAGCEKLKEVVNMAAIGTAYDGAFMGCTALESADISRLHVAGVSVFAGCTSLTEITTSTATAIGAYMFSGCTSLENVEINSAAIGAGAFSGCNKLKTVTYDYSGEAVRSIGARAFENCQELTDFTISGKTVASIGDYAFRNCSNLKSVYTADGFNPELGNGVFEGVASMGGSIIKDEDGTRTLVLAPATVTAEFADTLKGGTITAIGPNAFSTSRMVAGVTALDLSGITSIGSGAFRGLTGLESVTLNENLTEIPAYAFYGSGIKSIDIPDGVTKIGDYAFGGCSALATTNLDDLAHLTDIGAGAFRGTALTSVNLPGTVQTIGDEAFARCEQLTQATINSVKTMGSRVFALCSKLKTVVFGDNAESTGDYTFSTVEFGYNSATGAIVVTYSVDSALTSVEFGGKIKRIGEGVFAFTQISSNNYINGCDKLTEIDLNKVTEIGTSAFAGCTALERVDGIERVKKIESYAFESCTSLESLELTAAEEIHAGAFELASKLATVTFGNKLDGIGDYAFFGTALEKVEIPASCEYVGRAAFALNNSIKEIKVAADNDKYFDDGGVLYRYIDKADKTADKTYEITAYPAGRVGVSDGGRRAYTVLEGTVSVFDFAFYNVPSESVQKVILPYSMKLIGHSAFLFSGITVYQFESIEAPVLLQGVMDRLMADNQPSDNSFFYTNFGDTQFYLITHIKTSPTAGTPEASTLTILYPSNGTGYNNYIYVGYFGNATPELGEMPENSTRELLNLIEKLHDVETINGWRVGRDDETVAEFSETVKYAHELYNGLRTEAQLAYVGEAANKLFEVESALSAVKPKFGLQPKVSDVVLDASSSHRAAYRPGSRFSLNGVKIRVTYDDYSSEVINASGNFRLSARHDRALTDGDTFVTLEGLNKFEGFSADIDITVSGDAPADPAESNLSGGVIAAIVIGVAAVVAAAAVAAVIVLKKRRTAGYSSEDAVALDETDGGETQAEAETEAAGENEHQSEKIDGEEVAEDGNKQENSGENKTDD